ncbi:hypothetical protein V499_05771 [Pseudogymnoascus sp. VKM F-103]|nr:hypothetical protein V499_05771 [Pseudogymnoascus sp. VKM F-103]
MEDTEQQQQNEDAGSVELTEVVVADDEGAQDNNFHVETDGDSYDVVAVHGLRGGRRSTWTKEDSSDDCWIQEAFPRARVLLYEYDTSEETGTCFTRRGVLDEAMRLLESLVRLRALSDVNPERPIVFVSHGVGGLLIKMSLVLATLDSSKFGKTTSAVRALVFEKFTVLLGTPYEYCLGSEMPHTTMSRLSMTMINALQEIMNIDWHVGDLDELQSETMQGILSQTPPIYPVPGAYSLDVVPELDNLLTLETDLVLHIQCDVNNALASQGVYSYLVSHKPQSVNVLYFQFNPYDIRFNSIASMMRTFICQVGCHVTSSQSWPLHQTVNYMHIFDAWTTEDYMMYWDTFRVLEKTTEIYVIGGLDLCDNSSGQFLHMLETYFAECEGNSRFVITTTAGTNNHISAELSKLAPETYQAINVQSSTYLNEVKHQKSFELSMLLQEHPRYTRADLPVTIASLFDACENDHELCRIIAAWLKQNYRSLRDMEECLNLLSKPAPELVFDAILTGILEERQQWARILLSWVLLSVRALQAEELCIVSHIALENSEAESIQDILSWFGGMLQIKHNEVQFGHPAIRAWLELKTRDKATSTWWTYETSSRQHLDVLMICFRYLFNPSNSASPLDGLRHCDFPYVAQYWTSHYKLAKDAAFAPAREMAMNLFRDKVAFESWMKSYLSLADPFRKPSQGSNKPLAVAAHFGLDDLVSSLKEDPDEDCMSALIEAARQGHIHIFRALVPLSRIRFQLDDPNLESLIKGATSCGNKEVFLEAMKYMPDENPEPEVKHTWLSDMLLKGCWLGNEDLVGKVLDLGADLHVTLPEKYYPSPIGLVEVAARRDAVSVIKTLLNRNIDIAPGSGVANPTLVRMIGDYCAVEITRLILANGFSVETVDDDWTAVQRACSSGRFAVTDVLLDCRPIQEYIVAETPEPLLKAASAGCYKTTKTLLDHNVDISVSDKGGGNALYYATMENRIDICRLLLEKGIDVNFTSKGSRSPLIVAVSKGSYDIVKLFLDNGVEVEKQEDEGFWNRTALLVASAYNDKETSSIIKLLLEHGADPNVRDSDDWTPLYTTAIYGLPENMRVLVETKIDAKIDRYATCENSNQTVMHAAYNRPEIIRILLEHGMDADASILTLAAKNNQREVVELILERPIKSIACLSEPLLSAVANEYEDIVRLLLDAGGDVNATDDSNSSLLSIALSGQKDAIVRMLLEYRPDLEVKDIDGNTVLHSITSLTPVSSLKLVTNAGAKLNALNKWSSSPLSEAIRATNWDAARYLLSKKATIHTLNILSSRGTPLHRACRLGTLDIIKLLVQKGADSNIASGGMIGTPIMQACVRIGDNFAQEKDAIILYLLEECHAATTGKANTWCPIHVASLTCSADTIRLFLQSGAIADMEDNMGRKAVHLACYNSLSALEALGVSDRDFSAKDKVGRIPLHYAVLSGQLDLLKYVLEKTKNLGLGVDEVDNDGWTPLLWAARACDVYGLADDNRAVSEKEVARFLLDNKADPHVRGRGRGNKQWPARDIAIYHGASGLLEILAAQDPPRRKGSGPHKAGEMGVGFCDNCYLRLWGEYFDCRDCDDLQFCFKCYESNEVLHPTHEFSPKGHETDIEEEDTQSVGEQESIVADETPQLVHTENFDDEVRVVRKTTSLGYAIRAYQKIKGNEGRIMPAMSAELKLCGVRGVGTEVEVESGFPDQAMLAPFLPPA